MTSDIPLPKKKINNSYDHAPQLPEGIINADSLFTATEPAATPGAVPADCMLEIGPGRGRFALEYCQFNPHSRVLALEIRKKVSFQLDQRFHKDKLQSRARCFADDAREVLPRLQPDGAFNAVAIHFPDPWWKRRHEKRIVVVDDSVSQLARLVRKDGLVLVQTDVRDAGRTGSGFTCRA